MGRKRGWNGYLVAMICVVTTSVAAGCTSHEATLRKTLASADTVDVCESRGTQMLCSRHHATDYALHMERYREREEMRQLEQSEEW